MPTPKTPPSRKPAPQRPADRRPERPPKPAAQAGAAPALHRSGAVARMLQMPVATLRVWEQRYGLGPGVRSAGGQRLYAAEDLRRLGLLKHLTDRGHAIGTLAALDLAQLRQVAATHAESEAATRRDAPTDATGPSPARSWRLAVIGTALGERLRRPALLRRLGRAVELAGPFETAAQADAALRGQAVDAVLVQAPQLQAGWPARFDADAPGLARTPKAVLYGFAAESVCEALAAAGMALLREPQPDAVLAQWLHALAGAAPAAPARAAGAARSAAPVPTRRWDDAALARFAGMSSTMACECPRHVAELLMQLSHFEDYSAGCADRHAADAAIHAMLRETAATARARFETALEQVALHEGLLLPAAP